LNTPTPDGADGQRVADIGRWVAIDQQQVSAGSGSDTASVPKSEPACGSGSGSPERLDRRQSSCHQQLKFVVQAGTVGEAAEDR